jgi:hypothetical protein
MSDQLKKSGRIQYVAPTESQLADAVRLVNLFCGKVGQAGCGRLT